MDAESDKNGNIESTCKASAGVRNASMQGLLAGVVPAHLLDDGEQIILAIKPSMWFIVFDSARTVAVVLALMVSLRYLGEGISYHLSQRASQLAVIIILIQFLFSFLTWMSRLYVLTDRRVMRIMGIFNIDVFEAPLNKIQNTFLTLAIHERLFNLGSVHIATAGTGKIEASWKNINKPLEVHELLRAAMRKSQQKTPRDGL